MPLYIDVAAVRIQRYLSRTPSLRGRRGASAALVAATTFNEGTEDDKDKNRDSDRDRVLRGRADLNDAAGEVDGVLSLVVNDPRVLDDRREIDKLIRDVLVYLRQKLPGAEFQVAQGKGDTYLEARINEINPNIERGKVVLDMPTVSEFPLTAWCGVCRIDPAVTSVDLRNDDGVRDLCADCAMRHSNKIRLLGRTAEERLAIAIGAPPPDLKASLNKLAELGDQKSGGTHLATIHADGNSMGQFFTTLAGTPGVDRAEVVKEFTTCTFETLAAATCEVRRPKDSMLCVVPHVLGGDDVLVTLPADRAWEFIVFFLHDFNKRAERLVRKLGLDTHSSLTIPTMSAGLVFARRDFPFSLVVEQAEISLRQAKSAGAGQEAMVQFVDITSDGPTPPGQAISLAALKANQQALNGLVRLPRAHQARLGEKLRTGGPAAAKTLAQRVGTAASITPFLSDTFQGDEFISLDDALRIARWWRA